MRRVLLLALAAAAVAPLPAASAKEGVRARLETPLPRQAAPGQTLTLAWTLYYRERGVRRPFGAGGLFVRLLSPSGGAPVKAYGRGSRGRYVAQVRVPAGGIGGIELGLEGTRTFPGGRTEDADVLFPIDNPPARWPRVASTSDAGTSAPIAPALAAGAIAAAALLTLLGARRRRPPAARGT